LTPTGSLRDDRRLPTSLPRAVTVRPPYPDGALDVERCGLHPRGNGCEKNPLNDEAGHLAIEPHQRDRGDTRTRKLVPAEPPKDAPPVPLLTLLQLLAHERPAIIDALKVDLVGFEEVILRPFVQDANARLWPHLAIMENARGSWKTDLISMVIARSKFNVVLRRARSAPPRTRARYSLASRRR
jgi:hypothetical protein